MFGITKNAPIIFGGVEWQVSDGGKCFRASVASIGNITVTWNDADTGATGCEWWWWTRFTCFSMTGALKQDTTGFALTRDVAMQAALDAKQVFIADISRLAA